MNILVIGGTRNVGHHLVVKLAERGHRVTTFNRGRTLDELPPAVERLRGDRTDAEALRRSIGKRSFDAVVDTIAMRGEDSRAAVDILDGRVGHYIHFSTGQVYLVRDRVSLPAGEESYRGPLRPAPPEDSWESREWLYGVEKRECEDVLREAWRSRRFPATRLRLPMIHGERDHYGRIHGYVLRLLDSDPLIVPEEEGPDMRHVHAKDVVRAVIRLVEGGIGRGEAYNLTQDDAWTHERFVRRMGEALGIEPQVVPLPRAELIAAGVFPGCAPFTNPWMSILDNTRARAELGLSFDGFDVYVPELALDCAASPRPQPDSYTHSRDRERALIRS
jgi:nucleoside-diphosphate-sugar epimerase